MMTVINFSLVPEANALDQWDCGMVVDMLNTLGATYTTEITALERAVVLLPARHHKGLEGAVNEAIAKIDRVVLILLGDEEADFDVEQISHPNIDIWVQNPHPDKHDKYNRLGTGYPKHLKDNLPTDYLEKHLDVFFSGQVTHKRRRLLLDSLLLAEKQSWIVNPTKGFTQGFVPTDYYWQLKQAKVAPCPSGAVVPDSFRAFEALECFAVPLLDDVNPSGSINGGYWDWLLGENPLPKYKEPAEVPEKINEILADWDNISQQCIAWYIRYKDDIKGRIYEQYNR